MRRILFDSSLYMESLRLAYVSLLLARNYGDSLLWLSSVVVGELFAGEADRKAEAAIEKLCFSFQKARRLLTPSSSDWFEAGKLLARIGSKYGYEMIGRARMTNDALIAISARRYGVIVATLNTKDFELIREFYSFMLFGVTR